MQLKHHHLVLSIMLIGTSPLYALPENNAPEVIGLEEVLVTATRRQASVQEIPISVTALSAKTLAANGHDDFMDFAKTVPSLDYAQLGAGLSRASIRGISSIVGEALVGYYIDDAPITADQWGQPDTKVFDVDRVEVLRGPQGTLFGEGSIGGTIRILNNQPVMDEFEGEVQADVYSTAHGGSLSFGTDFMLNLPVVSDTWALRLVGSYRDEAGYIDNTFLGKDDVNTEEAKALRLMSRWTPTDKLTVDAAIHYNELDSGAFFTADKNLEQTRNIEEPRFDESYLYNLTVRYDLSSAEFISATSYFDRETGRPIDSNWSLDVANFLFSFLPVIYGPAFTLPVFTNIFIETTLDYEIFTQEFRLVSTSDSPLQWTVGAFYKDSSRPRWHRGNSLPTALPLGEAWPEGSEFFIDQRDNQVEQKAVFGEVSYEFNERWTGTLGLRYYEEDVRLKNTRYGIFEDPFNPATWNTDLAPLDDTSSVNVVTPKLSLSYAVSDEMMLYGLYAEGFRKGGVNVTLAVDFGAPQSYDNELVKSYEVGMKSSWLDNRMTINAAAFYNDWTDKQAPSSILHPVTGLPQDFVDNIGEAHTAGVEIEILALVAEGLEVSIGGNYVEAEIDTETTYFSDQILRDDPLANNLTTAPSGTRLAYTPEHSVHISAEYQWPVTAALTGKVRALVASRGDSFNSLGEEPVGYSDAYTTADLSFALSGGLWEARLYCSNCTNTLGSPANDLDAVGDDIGRLFFPIRPRTVGLRASLRF